jgi:hypothetical protein
MTFQCQERIAMHARNLAIGLITTIFAPGLAYAQKAPPASRPGAAAVSAADTTATARIIREIATHSQALRNLEHLADVIGPRLTGSDNLVRAHDWAERVLTDAGAANVHREAYTFGPSWTRGVASARLLTQNGRPIEVAQLAWSPATPGTVRGDLVVVNATTLDELNAYIGRFKDRVVTFGSMPRPGADTTGYRVARERIAAAIRDEGALAFLLPAGKREGLNMTGGPVWRLGTMLPQVPFAFVQTNDYAALQRAVARGEKVTIEINLPGRASATPVQAYNTIGEIRGATKPQEVVIIGAHLDSWDLGTGATDDGTGVVAVMEALRAIKATGLQPARTIRVVLFSGEEQGHWGSKAYVAAHASEQDAMQAALIHDLGTGRVRGFALQGREDSRRLMARAIAPLNDLGVVELPLERSTDSDHDSFNAVGVPGFFAIQDTLDYFSVTHHSQFDTMDRVVAEQLMQGTTAMAVTAWELANMPERLPHGRQTSER